MNNITTYNGNPFLKRKNVQISFTDEQIKEIIKCANDPIYFIETYVKIVNLDRGLITLILYEYQKKIINAIEDNRNVICKIPRQAGKTTALSAWALHQALFKNEYNILIAANKAKTAIEIMGKIQKAFENLPHWLQQGVIEWNKSTAVFENGSRIMAVATSSDAARGFAYNVVLLDEFAFLSKNIADEFFTSIYPTITSGKTTKLIIISTPKGLNHFYKMWVEAIEKRSNFLPVSIEWDEVPGRDQKFKEETIKNFGQERWDQEYECDFIGSSDTLIKSSTLKAMTFVEPMQNIETVKMYKPPRENRIYFIPVDASEGKGQDYQAFVVIDITQRPFEVVASYRDANVDTLFFPEIIARVGTKYNDAFILVETKSTGGQVADNLFNELEYPNLLGAETKGRIGQVLGPYKKKAKGLSTSKATKSIGCKNLKALIENEQLIVNDYDIVDELSHFIFQGSTYKAEAGHTDDLAMSLVSFSWATAQAYFKQLTDANVRHMYEEQIRNLEENLTPFGFVLDSYEDIEDLSGF